jgi:hypothetical protein
MIKICEQLELAILGKDMINVTYVCVILYYIVAINAFPRSDPSTLLDPGMVGFSEHMMKSYNLTCDLIFNFWLSHFRK